MNVKEIIIEKLKELGADGLCCTMSELGDNCACSVDEVYECDLCCINCVPAKIDNDFDDDEKPDDEMTILRPLNPGLEINCKEIIIEKLKELKADGLCNDDCGCSIDDFCLCDCDFKTCVPAIKIECPHCSLDFLYRWKQKKRRNKTNERRNNQR